MGKAQLNYTVGKYTGDGNATKAITGLNSQPDVIIVKSAAAEVGWIATSTMTAGYARKFGGSVNLSTGYISSIDATGFTVSNTNGVSNNNGTTYYWVAIKTGGSCKVGSYTGNGSSLAITGCGFQPEMCWIFPDAADLCHMDFRTLTDSKWDGGQTSGDYQGNWVSAWGADGFTANENGCVNGQVYHYVAFDEDNSTIDMGTWAGNNTDGQQYATAFTPYFAIVQNTTGTNAPIFRTSSYSGDASAPLTATANVTNRIQGLSASGIECGTNAAVNQTGSNYQFVVFGATTLPVKLIKFEAVQENENIKILWSTASEINSEYFKILRSSDGQNFEIINKVFAAGNSNTLLEYSIIDEKPLKGTNYYKLVEYDFDGTQQESEVITQILEKEISELLVYPNPANDKVKFNFNSETTGIYFLKIFNSNGIELYSALLPVQVGENIFTIPMQDYPSGVYSFVVYNNNSKISSQQIVKE